MFPMLKHAGESNGEAQVIAPLFALTAATRCHAPRTPKWEIIKCDRNGLHSPFPRLPF